ncbi:hypothetical protein ALP03_03491 [Pseudomonas amygdali pv. tabaci]|uniref:Uncharacterized protein n=1 Tax=Pseudomonas amygdali pv. tabaci TaxID=322 RepID=A0A3M6HSZ9_PSEAJ|nr:hypothetical protein ALP03_03491 [Pseudomonas amygdali pv. tabaci]
MRCVGEADAVGHFALLLVGHERTGNAGVDPDGALAAVEQRKVFVEAIAGGTRRAGLLHGVDVEVQRILPLWLIELWRPLLIEPASAKGVGQRGDQRHVLAPASLAAQAETVLFLGPVSQFASEFGNLCPGWAFGHGQAGGLEQVGAVVSDRSFSIERQGEQFAVHRKAVTHGREHIVQLVTGRQVFHFLQPAFLTPE